MSDIFSTPTSFQKRLFFPNEVAAVSGILGSTLLIWELATRLADLPPYLLPQPSLVVQTLWLQRVYYIQSSAVTLGVALVGLTLGVLVGILAALTITVWQRLQRGVIVLAILVKATPMVAIAPLLIIWFGFGPIPKVIITGLITFFPVLVNVHAGLNAVDESILSLFHSLNASKWEVLRHARWPAALPYLFTSLKVIGPLSFVGAVVAEWAGASAGLGRAMWLAYANLNMPVLFAAILCSAVMGITIYLFFNFLEKRIIFW
jgi:ABC-type nitrate/sulfonate/bicarbonate transport system permease component